MKNLPFSATLSPDCEVIRESVRLSIYPSVRSFSPFIPFSPLSPFVLSPLSSLIHHAISSIRQEEDILAPAVGSLALGPDSRVLAPGNQAPAPGNQVPAPDNRASEADSPASETMTMSSGSSMVEARAGHRCSRRCSWMEEERG